MPLYEYRCGECGLDFEVRQKFSDKPISACRHCGGGVKKLISQTAFSLKGGGWYEQGYSQGKSSSTSCPKTEKTEKTEKIEKVTKTEKVAKVANG